MSTVEIVESFGASLLWAAIFLWGGDARPMSRLVRDRRDITSFGAGMSVAYVFVHMMPELHEVRQTFAASISVQLPYEGLATYFLALVGFLTYYSLSRLRSDPRDLATTNRAGTAFWLHVGGFAAYVWVMGYLLVNSLRETETSIALYSVAIAVHFMAVDRAFRDDEGAPYRRSGRYVLAAMAVSGWGIGMLYALPRHVVALLVAFLSGAVIMNSTVLELRSDDKGGFLPMTAGGIFYGLILLPFG